MNFYIFIKHVCPADDFQIPPQTQMLKRYKQAYTTSIKMEPDQIEHYNFYLKELEKIRTHLMPEFGISTNLFDFKIGIFHLFNSITKSLRFISENHENSPFPTFATLARMAVDNYSIFYLLASYDTLEIRKLRYYLYVMASLDGRIKTVSDFEKATKNLPTEVVAGNKKLIEHDKSTIAIFQKKIISESLQTLTNEKIIEKMNWKFPSERPAGNKNFYNWQELYQISKIPSHFSKAIQQHFSEFTHGLGLSMLYSDEKSESKQSIIGILSIILSLKGKIIMEIFSEKLINCDIDKNFIFNCNYNWENWKE